MRNASMMWFSVVVLMVVSAGMTSSLKAQRVLQWRTASAPSTNNANAAFDEMYYVRNSMVAGSNRNIFYQIGARFYVSDDAGSTWRSLISDSAWTPTYTIKDYNDVVISSFGENKLSMCGHASRAIQGSGLNISYRRTGFIAITKDDGVSWTYHEFDSNSCVQSLQMFNDSEGVAIVQNVGVKSGDPEWNVPGFIATTKDGWKTFSKKTLPDGLSRPDYVFAFNDGSILMRVYFIPDKKYYLYVSQDSGATWQKKPTTPKWVQFVSPRLGYSVEKVGLGTWVPYHLVVRKTIDAGSTWTVVLDRPCEPSSDFLNVSFADENNGVVGTVGNVILKTIDAGVHWSEEILPFSICQQSDIRDIVMSPDKSILNGSTTGVIYQSNGATTLVPPRLTRPDPSDRRPYYPDSIVVNWQPILGADQYQFQVHEMLKSSNMIWYDESVSFKAPLFLDTIVRATETLIPHTSYNKWYDVRLRAIGGGDTSAWRRLTCYQLLYSTSSSSEIMPSIIVSPSNGSVGVATDTVYTWELVKDATSYDVQIVLNNVFPDYFENGPWVVNDSGLTTNSLHVLLPASSMLNGRVRAHVGSGVTPWSNEYNSHTIQTRSELSDVDLTYERADSYIGVEPNPASTYINIRLRDISDMEHKSIRILNQLGVCELQCGNSRHIDIQRLAQGWHWLEVLSDGEHITIPFVILR